MHLLLLCQRALLLREVAEQLLIRPLLMTTLSRRRPRIPQRNASQTRYLLAEWLQQRRRHCLQPIDSRARALQRRTPETRFAPPRPPLQLLVPRMMRGGTSLRHSSLRRHPLIGLRAEQAGPLPSNPVGALRCAGAPEPRGAEGLLLPSGLYLQLR